MPVPTLRLPAMTSLLPHLAAACLAACAAWATPSHGATVADSIAERVQACTACHGDQGRATADGHYPRLAGKPAGYLYQQLKHFQLGQRHSPLMTRWVGRLNDGYLWAMAEHFAALDLPYPAPARSTASTATLVRGQQLAQHGDRASGVPACVACHGATLTGLLPRTPGLLGLSRDYLNAQLGAWRTGARRAHAPDCMAEVARRLAPDDVVAVSAWLAAQPVPRAAGPGHASERLSATACGGLAPPPEPLPAPTSARPSMAPAEGGQP